MFYLILEKVAYHRRKDMNKNSIIAHFLLGCIKIHYKHRRNQHETNKTKEATCEACNAYKEALKYLKGRF